MYQPVRHETGGFAQLQASNKQKRQTTKYSPFSINSDGGRDVEQGNECVFMFSLASSFLRDLTPSRSRVSLSLRDPNRKRRQMLWTWMEKLTVWVTRSSQTFLVRHLDILYLVIFMSIMPKSQYAFCDCQKCEQDAQLDPVRRSTLKLTSGHMTTKMDGLIRTPLRSVYTKPYIAP